MAEEKKKKKERVNINLPNARRSMKRSREMRQMRSNYDDLWKFVGGLLAILVVLFILLGGINQLAAWNTAKQMAQNIGAQVKNSLRGTDIDVRDDGIYIDPNSENKNKEEGK